MTQATNVAQQFIDNLVGTLIVDEQKILQAPIDSYLSGVLADPSIINQQAQGVAFLGAVQGVLPQAGSIGIKDTATALKAFVDTQLPALAVKVQTELAANAAAAANPTPTAATPGTAGQPTA